jgi:hypothetical protein
MRVSRTSGRFRESPGCTSNEVWCPSTSTKSLHSSYEKEKRSKLSFTHYQSFPRAGWLLLYCRRRRQFCYCAKDTDLCCGLTFGRKCPVFWPSTFLRTLLSLYRTDQGKAKSVRVCIYVTDWRNVRLYQINLIPSFPVLPNGNRATGAISSFSIEMHWSASKYPSFVGRVLHPISSTTGFFFFYFFLKTSRRDRNSSVVWFRRWCVSLPGRLGHAMAGRPRTCFFFLFYSLFWPFGVCKGFVFLLLFRSLWESLSVLFCLVLVGLCSISSARAKSRAQAPVIRSHNSVAVDIRRITCISPSAPDTHRFTFFTCFLSLKRREKEIFTKISNSFVLKFFNYDRISELSENDRPALCAFVIVYFTKR